MSVITSNAPGMGRARNEVFVNQVMLWLGIGVLGAFIGWLTVPYPETYLGIAMGGTWTVVLSIKLYRVVHRTQGTGQLTSIATAGLLLRLPMLLVHLLVGFLIYGGQVDFVKYLNTASAVAQKLLSFDAGFFDLPFDNAMDFGWALMDRVLALNYLIMGPSVIGMFLLSALISFLGGYLFLRAFQIHFGHVAEQRFLALSLFLFPSLVFWTSLLGKDSWIYLLLGLFTYSLASALREFRPRYLAGMVLSVTVIGLFRPPVGVALIAGATASGFMVLFPRLRRLQGPLVLVRPVIYVAGLLFLAALIGGTGSVFRTFQGTREGAFTDYLLQAAVDRHMGSSTDAVGSGLAIELTDPSWSSVLSFLPKGIFTVLFRPLIFEAHNLVAAIASLDSTLLLGIVIVRFPRLWRAFRQVGRDPFLVGVVLTFAMILLALAFEWNFGVIVRHRTMALPFLFLLLAVPRRSPAPAGLIPAPDSPQRQESLA